MIKNTSIVRSFTLVLSAAVLTLMLTLTGCFGDKKTESTGSSDLKITDTVVGTGAEAKVGNTISVHYEGFLENGQKFDSSLDRGSPITFKLGAGMVIKGWDQGFTGMKVGGKRTLMIPSALGYGEHGAGPIPPNSNLKFNVELVDVKE